MIPSVTLRAPFAYDVDQASDASAVSVFDAGLTQQHFAEEADINTIVRRFGLTGELPTDVRAPQFADFVEAVDYHTAMNAIRQADEAFMALPADVRSRFQNDAGAFVAFCSDAANRAEAVKLGLVLPTVVSTTGAPAEQGAGTGST